MERAVQTIIQPPLTVVADEPIELGSRQVILALKKVPLTRFFLSLRAASFLGFLAALGVFVGGISSGSLELAQNAFLAVVGLAALHLLTPRR